MICLFHKWSHFGKEKIPVQSFSVLGMRESSTFREIFRHRYCKKCKTLQTCTIDEELNLKYHNVGYFEKQEDAENFIEIKKREM